MRSLSLNKNACHGSDDASDAFVGSFLCRNSSHYILDDYFNPGCDTGGSPVFASGAFER